MRAALLALLVAAPVHAQEAAELLILGAMVEGPEGTPLASATGIGGTPEAAVFMTSDAVLQAEGACLRIWDDGACHPMSSGIAANVFDGMAWMTVSVPTEDTMAKFTANPITSQPLVGVFDPATDRAQATFVTQNPFGGWERPVALVALSGGASGALTLRDPALTALSLGAPIVTAEKGLVGVVVRAVDGVAQAAGLSEVVAAASADGIVVDDFMRPSDPGDGALPPRVESELGRVIVFADQGSLGWIGGFYGPSRGAGFDETFVATIAFSVWEIPPGGAATRIAGDDKQLPLVPVGQQLEAPLRGRSPDHLASCVVHATPSSEGRAAMVLQFWRFNATMGTSQTGFRSFDEAAPPLTGWADGDAPCAAALGKLNDARRQALFGRAAAPSIAEAPLTGASDAPAAAAWRTLPTWDATGIEAVSVDFGDGTLTVGCTESRELAVTIRPGAEVDEITIGGRPAPESGRHDDAAYALFPGVARAQLVSGASIGWRAGADRFNLPGPPSDLLIGDC